MKGLVIKDLIIVYRSIKMIHIVFLILMIIGSKIYFKNEGLIYILLFLPFILIGEVKTTIQYDDKYNWNKCAIALPISRKRIVLSKYLLLIILTLFGSVLALSISYLSLIFTYDINIKLYLVYAIIGFLLSFFYGLILIPSSISGGGNVGAFSIMITTFLLMGIYYSLQEIGIMPYIIKHYQENQIPILLLFFIISLSLSYLLSLYSYNKKYN